MIDNNWQVPLYSIDEFKNKSSKYCVCIPVINEGERIKSQLKKMLGKGIPEKIDVIICDGGSSDNSLNFDFLKQIGIRALLTKKSDGKLSAQLRMGYAYSLEQGYEGIITIDGNNKDNVEGIFDFIYKLDEGYDFIQGSRYVKGGQAIRTPLVRTIAVKLIHIPIISLLAGFRYSDTTNGYRGYSRRLLLDQNIQPFRDIFITYELLAYLSVKAPKLGFKTSEIPVIREYPKGKTPTKISAFRGNIDLMKILLNLFLKKYDPTPSNNKLE